ncbi:MAG TPA: Flp pilus assembly protein CpaB [Thermoanaerobacterales bacterium]|nr:Flp pilus assembly protein CpaB [Thermoanaerobacterales bacterium]
MRNKIILVVAIIFGLVAAFGAYKYLETAEETYRLSGNYANVATAIRMIPAKTVINDQMLQFKEMPTEYIHQEAVVDAKDAVGKIAKSDIYVGEQVLSTKLMAKGEPVSGLSAKIDWGKRAITVPVNNVIALHSMLHIGDHVDILATFENPKEKKSDGTNPTVVSAFIQNVPILAINNMLEDPKELKDELQTVTLMVEPTQAQQIAMALDQGTIQFVLRNLEDKEEKSLPASKLEQLLR